MPAPTDEISHLFAHLGLQPLGDGHAERVAARRWPLLRSNLRTLTGAVAEVATISMEEVAGLMQPLEALRRPNQAPGPAPSAALAGLQALFASVSEPRVSSELGPSGGADDGRPTVRVTPPDHSP